jgi:hypothetical protein
MIVIRFFSNLIGLTYCYGLVMIEGLLERMVMIKMMIGVSSLSTVCLPDQSFPLGGISSLCRPAGDFVFF